MAVLKTHVIKSPNLMGWLYWRFTAINIENPGNGQLSAILYDDRGDRRKLQPLHRANLASKAAGKPSYGAWCLVFHHSFKTEGPLEDAVKSRKVIMGKAY